MGTPSPGRHAREPHQSLPASHRFEGDAGHGAAKCVRIDTEDAARPSPLTMKLHDGDERPLTTPGDLTRRRQDRWSARMTSSSSSDWSAWSILGLPVFPEKAEHAEVVISAFPEAALAQKTFFGESELL